jgi:plastocyanin
MKTLYLFILSVLIASRSFGVIHIVNVEKDKFFPASWSINKGDAIKWRFITGPHAVNSGADCTGDGNFYSGVRQANDSFTFVFKTAGYYQYYDVYNCTSGGGMTGLVTVSNTVSGIASEGYDPESIISLYPNPFSTSATLSYTIPKNGEVIINVIDMTGKKLLVINKVLVAGTYRENIQLENVPSGIYLVYFSLNGIPAKELTLVKTVR